MYNTSSELKEAILKDGGKAFEFFFTKHNNLLIGYVTALTRDRDVAEDITQQAFINLWSRLNTIPADTNLKQYLFKIAKNLYIDHYRKQKTKTDAYANLTTEALADQVEEENTHLQKRIKLMLSIIEMLPNRCQEVLRLTKLEGLTYQEVADRLDISVKTVDSQLQLAYKRIKKKFDEESSINLFVLYKAFERLPS